MNVQVIHFVVKTEDSELDLMSILQWNRHKKTLYLGEQLIAFLIIMADVHQKAIEESLTFISMNVQVIHLWRPKTQS